MPEYPQKGEKMEKDWQPFKAGYQQRVRIKVERSKRGHLVSIGFQHTGEDGGLFVSHFWLTRAGWEKLKALIGNA